MGKLIYEKRRESCVKENGPFTSPRAKQKKKKDLVSLNKSLFINSLIEEHLWHQLSLKQILKIGM